MLAAEGATKRYGSTLALDALDLTVAPGEIVCLLGANGAGKTTTISLFLGFIAPDGGRVSVDDIESARDPAEARKRLAYIPENVALYPAMTGIENLTYFDRISGHKRDRDTLKAILTEAGLSGEQMDRPVSGYSKGMRQKVGLAIAFAKEAKALLLDEPMSGLDPKAASEFVVRLRGFRESGRAILMATHDIFRAKECADRIGIMRAGRLVEMLDAAQMTAADIERLYLAHMHEGAAA